MCFYGKCSEISVLKINNLAFAAVFCHHTCLKYAVPKIRGVPSECIWDCLNVFRVAVHGWYAFRQIRLNCLCNVTLKRKTKMHAVKAVAVIYFGVKATRKQVKFSSSWESIISRRYGWVGAVKAGVKGTGQPMAAAMLSGCFGACFLLSVQSISKCDLLFSKVIQNL